MIMNRDLVSGKRMTTIYSAAPEISTSFSPLNARIDTMLMMLNVLLLANVSTSNSKDTTVWAYGIYFKYLKD